MSIKRNLTNSSILLKSHVNRYTLLGLMISFTSIMIASLFVSYQLTGHICLAGFIEAQKSNPAIWILDITPFLFAYWGQAFCYGLVNKAESILVDKTNEFLNKSGDLEFKLKYEIQHDELTKLPNTRLFSEQIAQAIDQLGESLSLAVIVLKINDFKSILYNFGNFNANTVIKQFSEQLKTVLVEPFILQATMGINLLARIEGDEFAFLFPRMNDHVNLKELLSSITQATTVNYMVDGISVDISTTAGIAMYSGPADNNETLIHHAQIAVYQARREGKPYIIYQSHMEEDFITNRIILNELKQAIEHDGLEIYYQPSIELSSGKIINAEALVRFEHEKVGLISAEKFIPLIEGSNLIHKLSRFMLKQVIKQLQVWHQAGFLISVSVNLSAQDAVDKSLPGYIEKLLKDNKLAPKFLKLEFSERACLADQTKSLEVMNNLSKLGVRLCIDDFCSGYSSFIYLTNFPINEVKIERSIVLNMNKDEKKVKIVEAIIKLAEILNIEVCADGIADQNIRETLKKLGCLNGQGYFYSRAVSAGEFESLLKSTL